VGVKSRGDKAGVVLLIAAAFAFANCGETPNYQRDGDAGSGGDSAGTGGAAGGSGGMGLGSGGPADEAGAADDVDASADDLHDDADTNGNANADANADADEASGDGNLDGVASNDVIEDAAHDTDGSNAACLSTMLPAGFYCHSLPDVTCGECLQFHSNGETVCNCLAGTAKADCQALLTCLSPTFFTCLYNGFASSVRRPCYCSDDTCSHGADSHCVAQYHAVAGTATPAEVIKQMEDPSTTIARVIKEARQFSTATTCTPVCDCL
jgi:hypothetical protein